MPMGKGKALNRPKTWFRPLDLFVQRVVDHLVHAQAELCHAAQHHHRQKLGTTTHKGASRHWATFR